MAALDNRYGLINHPYLHYGVISTAVNFAAGVASGDCVILATAAGITITLPDAAAFKGSAFYIKNADTGGNVNIATTAGAQIDGAAGPLVIATNISKLLVSDGTNWWILAAA